MKLFIICIFVSSLALAGERSTAEQLCMEKVTLSAFEEIIPTCVWPIQGNLIEALNHGHSHYQHGFGTRTHPSEAAAFIIAKAKAGDADFQYLWGNILALIYQRNEHQNVRQRIKQHQSDRLWFYKAADQGQIGAILHLINLATYPLSAPIEKSKKQRLLGYADLLIKQNIPQAHLLKVRVRGLTTNADILEEIAQKVNHFRALEEHEILELAKSLTLGRYSASRYAIIEIDKQPQQAIKLYRYLVDTHGSFEAAYHLALLLQYTDKEQTLQLMQQSATGNFAKAVGWMGDYWACNNDKTKALQLLHKADKLGLFEAQDSIGEIEDLGKPLTCDNDWVRRP